MIVPRPVSRSHALFLLLRVLLALLPASSGYLHPDEHFQTVEPVLGRLLGLFAPTHWEWTGDSPIRSPTVPLILYTLPMWLLTSINNTLHLCLGINIIGPLLLQLLPRVILLLLSFSTDLAVLHLSRLHRLDSRLCLELAASSHVLLVYGLRTLSNSVELAMFSLLLLLSTHDKTSSWPRVLGLLLVLATFSRPTFLVFAAWPLVRWLFRGSSSIEQFKRAMAQKLVPMLSAIVVTAVLLVIIDSIYYGPLTVTNLLTLDFKISDLKVTPWNFISFNRQSSNIAVFGAEPWHSHLLTSLPLLLGPLAPLLVKPVITYLSPWRSPVCHHILVLAFLLPLLALSLVSHQEPRFLLPLLPLAILNTATTIGQSRSLLGLWHVFNLLATLLLGFLNHSGVRHIQAAISSLPHSHCPGVDMIHAHVWAPPQLPLLCSPGLTSAPHVRTNCTGYGGAIWPYGLPLTQTALHEKVVVHACRREESSRALETLLVVPGHMVAGLRRLDSRVTYHEVASYWPSLAPESLVTEDMADISLSPSFLIRTVTSLLAGGGQGLQEGWCTLALLRVHCGQEEGRNIIGDGLKPS